MGIELKSNILYVSGIYKQKTRLFPFLPTIVVPPGSFYGCYSINGLIVVDSAVTGVGTARAHTLLCVQQFLEFFSQIGSIRLSILYLFPEGG